VGGPLETEHGVRQDVDPRGKKGGKREIGRRSDALTKGQSLKLSPFTMTGGSAKKGGGKKKTKIMGSHMGLGP